MKQIKNDSKSFSVKFNSKNNNFKPKFQKEETSFNPTVAPQTESPEEVYYDEIVFYDGGGVEGYGYS